MLNDCNSFLLLLLLDDFNKTKLLTQRDVNMVMVMNCDRKTIKEQLKTPLALIKNTLKLSLTGS